MTTTQIPANDTLVSDQLSIQTSPSRQQTLGAAANFILGNRQSKMSRPLPSSHPIDQTYNTNPMVARQDEQYTAQDIEYLKHLAHDFGDLLYRVDMSDCFLRVRGVYMAVHRCVLVARSNTFAAVISGNFNRLADGDREQIQTLTEKEKLVIVLDKIEPDIMKQVLIFMYSGRCSLNEQNAFDLLDAAGRYDIKSLKVYTAQLLVRQIGMNNILQYIEAAYKYNNALLKQHCISYFLEHSREIMDIHQTWKSFADGHPQIVSELFYWKVHPQEFAQTNQSLPNRDSQW